MKPSIVVSLMLISATLAATAFTARKLHFSAHIQGIENRDVSLTGIGADEFSVLTVETSDKDRSVTRFEIILARGQSPVYRASVEGNSFDLNKFKENAKPGDRAVLEVKTVSGSDKLITGDERIVTIPIK
jgi:hypothetical protein